MGEGGGLLLVRAYVVCVLDAKSSPILFRQISSVPLYGLEKPR